MSSLFEAQSVGEDSGDRMSINIGSRRTNLETLHQAECQGYERQPSDHPASTVLPWCLAASACQTLYVLLLA